MLVANGYSELILDLYGEEAGMHARTAAPMHVPLYAPFNCETEVKIDGH